MSPTPQGYLLKIPRALAWTTALRVLTRLVAVGSVLLTARLISPQEFGIYAAILIANQAISAATDLSIAASILQMERDPRRYLDTAWTVGIARGFLLFGLMLVGAPVWVSLFNVPEAADMLRVLAISHVILGFHDIGSYLLRRELMFGRIFLLHGSEVIAYAVSVITLGAIWRSAWALVFAVIVSSCVRVAVSFWISPHRARLGFDSVRFREMFRYSRWLTVHSLVDFVVETVDNAVVAAAITSTALAFYRMAYQFATEGSTGFQWVVAAVAFPAIARIQLDRSTVRGSFQGVLGLTACVLVPFTIAMVSLGPEVLPIVLGDRWSPVSAPLQVLAVAALIRAVLETGRPLLLAVGRTGRDLALKLFQAAALLILVYPAARLYGLQGVAWAVLVAAVLTLPFWFVLIQRTTGLGARDMAMALAAPLVAGLVSATALVVVPSVEASWSGILSRATVLAVAYLVVTLALLRILPISGLGAALRAARPLAVTTP